jgi:hypothetical protein
MGVQKFATTRNAQVEALVDYVLELFCRELDVQGVISNYAVESQSHYESLFASDIWDHLVTFTERNSQKKVQLWCQTTCYKGNATGKPEPNKTYEVRETLVEAISIREKVISSKDIIRTVHLTVGSKKYTYDWFASAKENTFDLSLYLDLDSKDVFEEVSKCFDGVTAEFQLWKNFSDELFKKSDIGKLISSTKERLINWQTKESMPMQTMANSQYYIVENELKNRKLEISECVKRAPGCGIDVKGRSNRLVHGSAEKDELIIATVDLLLQKNPFIKAAKNANEHWTTYSARLLALSKVSNNLSDYIKRLWTIEDDLGLVVRRLLLRIGSRDSVHYVQDLDIEGVTEHNLYKGKLSLEQLEKVVEYAQGVVGVKSVESLYKSLISTKAKRILRSSIWFEAENGTSLKPSFDYIELALEQSGYKLEKCSSHAVKAVGYHSEFAVSGERVNPYTNLKLILDSDGKVLAFLKGKFFRQQEFPRRCKEEAYTSITLKNELVKEKFSERFSIPLIMFVDMPADFSPPEYALRRLLAFGWRVAFNKEDILRIIQ